MFLPYVYIVRNRNTGEFYIGMRSANKVVAEEDLGTYYFTSSKYVKNNFSEFDKEIIAYFKDQISAFEFENDLIEQYWRDPLLLNKHYQKSMTKFSMTGVKRPDLAEYNRIYKKRPKEIRQYQCTNCKAHLSRVEFCHHLPKKNYYCNAYCCMAYVAKFRDKPVGNKKTKADGRSSWNKGIPNPQAAENGRKGAAKLSSTVIGRKRLYKEDGSWTWQYPKK